jgi:hypothetical protein
MPVQRRQQKCAQQILKSVHVGVDVCCGTVKEIRRKLRKYNSEHLWKKATWAAVGHEETQKLNSLLDTQSALLSLRLDTLHL